MDEGGDAREVFVGEAREEGAQAKPVGALAVQRPQELVLGDRTGRNEGLAEVRLALLLQRRIELLPRAGEVLAQGSPRAPLLDHAGTV